MNEKAKSITLTRKKVADVDGEHRVTFVASSANEDRDHEVIEIGTFKLPLKGGGSIRVDEIPAEGTDLVDVPLLTDHDVYEVDKTIGSVRKAYYANGELVFEAGISSRPYAQEIYTLIAEKHLDNAFSISFGDYNYNPDTKVITDGEIYEVSVVTRGSNRDARVLSAKGLKEDNVENKAPETPAEEETKTEEAVVEQAPAEPAEKSVEPDEAKEVEETQVDEAKSEEPVEKPAETKSIKSEEGKEKAMDKEIAKSMVKEPSQAVTAKAVAGDYLKSKQAMTDFRDIIVSMKGQSSKDIMKAWGAKIKEKGITGDAILPSTIEQIFFKTWYDETSPLSTFRTIRTTASAMNAFTGEGENIRAKGHKKGDTKADQVVENLRRDLKAKLIYKKLPIDLQDLIDDETGELTAFRAEELAQRVLGEIVRGAIPGDGRTAPAEGQPDYRVFDGTRGLFSMKADLDTAGTPVAEGENTAVRYARAVATVVANEATDNLYDKTVKVLAQIRDKGFGKAIAVEPGAISTLKLLKGEDGHYIFPAGSSVEEGIEARVFEVEGIEGSGYDVIGWAQQGYGLHAGDEMVRTAFDVNTNEDTMLVERSAAGSLFGHRSCAGYKSAA